MPAAGRDAHRWRRHRTFHVDGSTFSMPDTSALRAAFGAVSGQAKGCGFPVAQAQGPPGMDVPLGVRRDAGVGRRPQVGKGDTH